VEGESPFRPIDDREPHRLPSRTKKAVAFFRMSRSWRRISFSRRSRCTRRTASSANSFVNRRCCVIEFLIAHGELSTFPKQVQLGPGSSRQLTHVEAWILGLAARLPPPFGSALPVWEDAPFRYTRRRYS